ncbi:hypothetical protein NDU88_003561 [Pleurodeles waltl]|uniref:Uncharacterized protein n=1 Tax=Pleurodeles waltl TaxID=8319 RepID=A0AAV7TQZ0_PLEWA|nr:hypothetical protein NDU88_003561 [Pleurodeles waltl]
MGKRWRLHLISVRSGQVKGRPSNDTPLPVVLTRLSSRVRILTNHQGSKKTLKPGLKPPRYHHRMKPLERLEAIPCELY